MEKVKKMKQLVEGIDYLEATSSPLSAESFIIPLKEGSLLYDVGAHPAFLAELNQLPHPLSIVISHFHQDHLGNIASIPYEHLYGSKLTLKHVEEGELVLEKRILDEDIEIGPIPSSHEKGCLYLKYHDYLFLGDAAYPANDGYHKSRLMETILALKQIEFRYAIESHQAPKIESKEELMNRLKQEYLKL